MFQADVKPINLTINCMADTLADKQSVLTEVGLFAKQLIAQRTARGVDWKGFKFKNYDPAYKKARHKKGLPTTNVDLFATGHMMGAIKSKAFGNTAKVYFASKHEADKAGRHQVGDGVPARHFFDLTPSDVADAQQIITDWFENGCK